MSLLCRFMHIKPIERIMDDHLSCCASDSGIFAFVIPGFLGTTIVAFIEIPKFSISANPIFVGRFGRRELWRMATTSPITTEFRSQ